MSIQIAPSLLAADFANLEAAAQSVPGADWLHVDVMDNHFVPNLTLGVPVVRALAKVASQPLDCHLMIEDPDRWAPAYVEAGAGSVTFHLEACRAPVRLARELHSRGARAGVAVKPGTAVAALEDLVDEVDMILVMTVEPGFGGQDFLDLAVTKVQQARRLIGAGDAWLQVDGGVSETTIQRCATAGADVFVAGSAVFGAADPDQAVQRLRRLAAESSNLDGSRVQG